MNKLITEHYVKAGIYKITCTENQKCYIGSSINILDRFRCHIANLRKGNHHSVYMQNSFNKYGEECFKFEILVKIEYYTEEILRNLEYMYIDWIKPDFNSAIPILAEKTSKWRQKIAKSTKKLYQNGYVNPRLNTGNKYRVYNYLGELLIENISLKDVAIFIGAKDYHFLNNTLRKYNGITTFKRGKFIILRMDKTVNDFNNYMKNIKIKDFIYYDNNGNIYEGKLTYEQKKLKEKIFNAEDRQYTKNGITYYFPCLQSDAV